MERPVFVSETEIAFWGAIFPRRDVQPIRVEHSRFRGKDVEVLVFAFPERRELLDFVSIEQNMSIPFGALNYDDYRGLPVRKGFRMAAYERMAADRSTALQHIHSALQFGRCFYIPPAPRAVRPGNAGDAAREERNKDFRTRHSERLQHMSGVRNMSTRQLKTALVSNQIYGVNFAHFALHALKRGVRVMTVEVMRLWLAGCFSAESVQRFMADDSFTPGVPLCALCHLEVTRPATCIVKAGWRWVSVQIEAGGRGEHITLPDQVTEELLGDTGVVYDVDHLVTYRATTMIARDDLLVGRVVRWFHRYLKCVHFGLNVNDPLYNTLVHGVLMTCLRCNIWATSEFSLIYRVQSAGVVV